MIWLHRRHMLNRTGVSPLGEGAMTNLRNVCVALTLAGALSACSGDGGLSTASLLGTKAAPQVDEPTQRALHSAAISARASKCGYNFDPNKLRDAYLASEAAAGATPEQMTKLSQSYEFTRATISKQISNPEEYCSENTTRTVSAALTKQLAGDFKAPYKPPLPKNNNFWWDTSASDKKMNTDEVFNPRHGR
jgi:hypothetical protein